MKKISLLVGFVGFCILLSFVFSWETTADDNVIIIGHRNTAPVREVTLKANDTQENFNSFQLFYGADNILTGGDGSELAIVLSPGSFTVTPPRYGDVNLDDRVTVEDAILVIRYIVGLRELTDEQLLNGKVSVGDGSLNVTDAILILRYIVGLIDQFPVEKLLVELPEGLGKDEFDFEAAVEKNEALSEALYNNGDGERIFIPAYPLHSYYHKEEITENLDGKKVYEIKVFNNDYLTYFYNHNSASPPISFLANIAPDMEESVIKPAFNLPPFVSRTNFRGAQFKDGDGNYSSGTISIHGNVVIAGNYMFDFGDIIDFVDSATLSDHATKIWDHTPLMFDPMPPDCAPNAEDVYNGWVFTKKHHVLTSCFITDTHVAEFYEISIQHGWEWQCPDGPLERVMSVKFVYSRDVYGETPTSDYQEAFYIWRTS